MKNNLSEKMHRIEFYVFGAIIILITILSFTTESFMTLGNWLDLLDDQATRAIFAMGLLVVLVSGNIDISFTSSASVVQYVTAVLSIHYFKENLFPAILSMITVGILLGLINAFFVCRFKMISIIVTIATSNVYFGFLMYFSKGKNLFRLPEWWLNIVDLWVWESEEGVYLVTLPMALMVAVIVITGILLKYTGLGHQLYAQGGSETSAKRMGLKVHFLHSFAFSYMGLVAGIGGFVQSYRNSEVIPNALYGQELPILAAVVLGGASLMGGKGSVTGTILGVLLIAIIQNGLNLLGFSTYIFDAITGLVILVAIGYSHWLYKKNRKEMIYG